MSKTKTPLLQLNSFKNWKFGEYTITQYKAHLFIISCNGKDVWKTLTLRGAVKYALNHRKAK